eukprot:GFUD01020538.1.p1 GENE.GFUD01020538.1~~GFUD01020538.1.p1  ORF type:complete len:169 (-),score=57.22 GFUD01020538.1:53-559(-)
MSLYTTLIRSVPTITSLAVRLNTTKVGLASVARLSCPVMQTLSSRALSCSSLLRNKEFFTITYELGGGGKHTVQAKDGDNLLDIAINNDIDIDGFGACEGTLACSTCHVVFTEEDFAKLDEEATDEELDMLDLAFALTDTSRLGCQVCMSKELDGITVLVPEGVNDQR